MPLPGWDHPMLQRRRDAMRDAVSARLPLPASRRRSPARTWFTRVALWLGTGMLVAVFAVATDPTRVAVVATLSAIAAAAWSQLSWAFRAAVVAGLLWLSVARFGTGLGFALVALLTVWWWLPMQVTGDGTARAEHKEPEEDLSSLVTPAGAQRPYELPLSGQVPPSLRKFAEERRLPEEELTMLASIRFAGEPPRTTARWHHIYTAIRMSRWLDKENA